jgi:spermidine/putrescine-binding protein
VQKGKLTMIDPHIQYLLVKERHARIRNKAAADKLAKQLQQKQPTVFDVIVVNVKTLYKRINARGIEPSKTSDTPQMGLKHKQI